MDFCPAVSAHGYIRHSGHAGVDGHAGLVYYKKNLPLLALPQFARSAEKAPKTPSSTTIWASPIWKREIR